MDVEQRIEDESRTEWALGGGKKVKLRSTLHLSVLAAFVMGACVASQDQAAPSPANEELRIGYSTLLTESLDPLKSSNNSGRYLRMMFDDLVGVDLKGETISKDTGIAKDWAISPDYKTYTFTIRQDVKFSNGEDLTAEDVKFSLDRLKGPVVLTSLGKSIAGLTNSVDVTGPYEVKVQLKTPSPVFLTLLSPFSDVSGMIVPKEYFQSVGEDEFGKKPIGSGPYKLVDRKPGVSMTFEQVAPQHFAVGALRFKRVIVRLITDETQRVAQLQGGGVDFIDLSNDAATSLKGSDLRIFTAPVPQVPGLFFQLQKSDEVLRDVNIRKALSYAIDRTQLNQILTSGFGQPAGNVFTGQDGAQVHPPTPYDPAMAKQFLSQTLYGPGGKKLTIQLQASNQLANFLVAVQAIQGYWRAIGIDSVITYRDQALLRQDWIERKLPSPAVFLQKNNTFHNWQPVAFAEFACGGGFQTVCDPELDKLLTSWGSAPDDASYRQLAVQSEKYILENFYHLPLAYVPLLFAGTKLIPDDYSPGTVTGLANERNLLKRR